MAPKLRALGQDYHPDCFKCEVKCIATQFILKVGLGMSLTCNNNICMSLDGTRPEKGPWEVGKETENFNCLDTLTFKPKKSITNVIIAEVWLGSRGWMLPQEQQTLLP